MFAAKIRHFKPLNARFFQVKRTKVLLLKDHPTLGFAGEWVFVKPTFALDDLVVKKIGKNLDILRT